MLHLHLYLRITPLGVTDYYGKHIEIEVKGYILPTQL